jgi:hypothetical protein
VRYAAKDVYGSPPPFASLDVSQLTDRLTFILPNQSAQRQARNADFGVIRTVSRKWPKTLDAGSGIGEPFSYGSATGLNAAWRRDSEQLPGNHGSRKRSVIVER